MEALWIFRNSFFFSRIGKVPAERGLTSDLTVPTSSVAVSVTLGRFFGRRNFARRLCDVEVDVFHAFCRGLAIGFVLELTPICVPREGAQTSLLVGGWGVYARRCEGTGESSYLLNLREAAETESLSDPLSEESARAPAIGATSGA